MSTFVSILFLLAWIVCTVFFVIGMINPKKALIPYAKKGRKQVFLSWFLVGFICFVLFIVGITTSADPNNEALQDNIIAETTQSPTPTIKPTTEPTAKPTTEPTQSPTPTIKPTTEPTAKPTVAPTPIPALDWFNNLVWVTTDANVGKDGALNTINSIDLFTNYTAEEIKTIPVTVISLEKMEQAQWKYTGKLVTFSFEISDIASYAPNSDTSNSLANGEVCGEVSGFDPVGYTGYSSIIIKGSDCTNYDTGDELEVTAILLGYFEGQNAYGGTVQNMMFYTVPALIK